MHIKVEQGSDAWFAERCGRVTASRASDMMAKGRSGAISATRSAYMAELVAEILTGSPVNTFQGNADTQRGIELEPAARLAYEAETGNMVERAGLFVWDRDNRAAASPDGLIGQDGGLEIKCPKPHVHLSYLLGRRPPPAYVPQMTFQVMCAGLSWVDFVSYCPVFPEDMQLFVIRFAPTHQELATMETETETFLAELDALLVDVKKLREAA